MSFEIQSRMARENRSSTLGVVLEEADESVFWLEMLSDCEIVPLEKLKLLIGEAHELSAIFTASRRTAKSNLIDYPITKLQNFRCLM